MQKPMASSNENSTVCPASRSSAVLLPIHLKPVSVSRNVKPRLRAMAPSILLLTVLASMYAPWPLPPAAT